MSRTPSRRSFVAGGLAAAGGTLAAGALSMTGASELAFAQSSEAPFPKTPDEALARLLAGNKRSVQGQPDDQLLDAAIHENVKMTQQALGQISTFADPVQSGKLEIVGYEYQLRTGKVTPVE